MDQIDQIDRELASALSLEPSPEFRARVRARVAGEPAARSWPVQWRIVGAGVAAVAVVSAIVIGRVNLTERAGRSVAVAVDRQPLQGAAVNYSAPVPPPRIVETVVRGQAPRKSALEVLVASSEVRGLRQLEAIAHDGRVQFVFHDERELDVEHEPVKDIVVAPIVIAPLEADVNAAANLNAEGE